VFISMRFVDGQPVFSPSDLTGYLACDHLLTLELRAMAGEVSRPERDDPELAILARRGLEHETRYLERLRADGRTVVDIGADTEELSTSGLTRLRDLHDRTVAALRSGPDVIYQGAFFDGRWQGFADFLLRVERPSRLGSFSYEVADTKLARHAKAAALLQTCAYSAQLEAIQGRSPDAIHVVLGDDSTASFRHSDFSAYFRAVRTHFDEAVGETGATYPERVEHCSVCRWADRCTAQWRSDDHLNFVAGLARSQITKLSTVGVSTLTSLARSPLSHVAGMADRTLGNLERQARLQLQQRETGVVTSELLPLEGQDRGLARLPEKSDGDLFFDMEGDPLIQEGLEYLFGVAWEEGDAIKFRPFWGHDRAGEKRAFEEFIDFVLERRQRFPELHVYHYASYEETALKKLMGRHATREDAVDTLLREGVLVDLYRVVRQSVVVSQESYSIKKLEPLYMEPRSGVITDAGGSIVAYETWLETGEQRILDEIEAYNRDDCVSTLGLRDWLERQRVKAEAQFGPISRPPVPARPPESSMAPEDENADLIAGLTVDVPADSRSDAQQAKWLLAQLLGYHRREKKSQWWEYFDRCDMNELELIEDGHAIGALAPEGEPEKVVQSWRRRYRFPADQDHRFKVGDSPHDPSTQKKAGEIVELGHGVLVLNHGRQLTTPTALIPPVEFNERAQKEAIRRLARWVVDNDIDAPGYARAGRDILLRQRPRLLTGAASVLREADESASDAARRLALLLDGGCLPVQGPPGTGKTSTGAEMAIDLVLAGKKVGIVAQSHAVIGNFLDAIWLRAAARKVTLRVAQRSDVGQGSRNTQTERLESKDVRDEVVAGLDIVGGTSFLFAREDVAELFDVLFIDEAGQFALANAIAVAGSARNIVLLGDPNQLAQPSQGAHPTGSDASVLEHMLGEDVTIAGDAGLFLDRTHRLRPEICAFVSDAFYEGRLEPTDDTVLRTFVNSPNGMTFEPVVHTGNAIESQEEVERVCSLINGLIGLEWRDERGTRQITLDEILVVAPYNAHVELLLEQLPKGARVGTVDKFQGQQAPVVIYSMASSTPDDAPRGMAFLYSRNRLNVAVSRAQGLAIVVASPALFRVRCKTPEQMRLANALCLFAEMARGG
jgi:predicted RecB family nuclease